MRPSTSQPSPSSQSNTSGSIFLCLQRDEVIILFPSYLHTESTLGYRHESDCHLFRSFGPGRL